LATIQTRKCHEELPEDEADLAVAASAAVEVVSLFNDGFVAPVANHAFALL